MKNLLSPILPLAFVAASLVSFGLACKPINEGANKAQNNIPGAGEGGAMAYSALDTDALLKAQGRSIPVEYQSESSLRSGKTWQYLQNQSKADLEAYLKSNQSGYDAFSKVAVAFNGTPAVIFRLLPDVMPEVFSGEKFEKATGYFKSKSTDLLPYGLAFTQAPSQQPGPLFVNLTCAVCHTGRVILPDGSMGSMLGAPSTVADVSGFRGILTQAVNNPSYTIEKFNAALMAKKDGELYGPERIAQEKVDKAIFLGSAQSQALGATILAQFKDGLLKSAEYSSKTVGAYSLKGDLRLLGHSPGHIDFPIAVSLAAVPPTEVLADPANSFKKYLPAGPGVGDIMSVWQQESRTYAQWDGNLKAKLFRNLGAELGIAGGPKPVNFPNALLATTFVDKLPAPAYPFKVDLVKAAAGKKIYDQACASCHESEAFVPVAQIGTEPGRATGLTKDTRIYLVEALKAACSDKTNPGCTAPDEEIVVPRHENPGYISLPLSGIWARAPYLHNGSVPTVYHLLVAEERPSVFQLNDLRYDEKKLGFMGHMPAGKQDNPSQQRDEANQSKPTERGKSDASPAYSVSYDTSIHGFENKGHSDIKVFNGGIDFKKEPQKLDALLEYLKTL